MSRRKTQQTRERERAARLAAECEALADTLEERLRDCLHCRGEKVIRSGRSELLRFNEDGIGVYRCKTEEWPCPSCTPARETLKHARELLAGVA